jgi:Protein of unknown function (DUF4232)
LLDGAQGVAYTKGTPVFSRAVFSGAASAAALLCLAVAGCSSSASQPTTPATTTTVTASPTASGASSGTNTPAVSTSSPAGPVTSAVSCATSSLNIKQGLAQGYAGGVYEVIDFTNTSNSPCSLLGYPGVSLVTGPPHTQIGLAAKRSTTSGTVKLITLAPGATANAQLQIVDALNFPSATCGPTKAAALKVYPPNQTAPVYLPNTSEACTKSVQTMNIAPVQAGSGGST